MFFRAVGTDFQKKLVVDPFDMVDVYPLMCHLLGINPEVNDGHSDNTKHMLVPKTSTGGDNDSKCAHVPIHGIHGVGPCWYAQNITIKEYSSDITTKHTWELLYPQWN